MNWRLPSLEADFSGRIHLSARWFGKSTRGTPRALSAKQKQ